MEQEFWFPVQLSLQVSMISTLIVFGFGLIVARLMTYKTFRGFVLFETFIMMPLVLPPSVIGFFLLVFFGKNSIFGVWFERLFDGPIIFTWWAAILASSVVAFPLMYQSAKAGFQSIDRTIEEAARVDGANELQVFWKITLPLSSKAIITGIILSFARALGEFGATLMFAGNIPGKTQTIPTAIYVAINSGNMTMAWKWVATTVIISFTLLIITNIFKKQ